MASSRFRIFSLFACNVAEDLHTDVLDPSTETAAFLQHRSRDWVEVSSIISANGLTTLSLERSLTPTSVENFYGRAPESSLALIQTQGVAQGDSLRLGNFLNEWFLGDTCVRLPPSEHCTGQPSIPPKSPECHGHPGASFHSSLVPLNLVQPKNAFGGFLTERMPEQLSVVEPYCGGKWWWSYFYNNWQSFGGVFQEQIRPLALEFATQHYPHVLPDGAGNSDRLVVHYRMGDPEAGTPEPQAVLRGVRQLLEQAGSRSPRSIVVLACSYLWLRHDLTLRANYARLKDEFIASLRRHYPDAAVREECGTADEDWLRMVFADQLVTTFGSYAVTAAAANVGLRCTMGVPNLVYPRMPQGNLPEVPHLVRDNWTTYSLVGTILD